MARRPYRLGARAVSMEATRTKIVHAAMARHERQGVMATTWDDIATEADVALATVHRHFPSLDELIPACARTVFDIIRPPTVEEAGAQFAELDSATARLTALVERSCHCYAAGEGWLHAAHRERDFVAPLDGALGLIETTLDALVTAAAGRRLAPSDHLVLFVLCNFPFWKSLRDRGAGLQRAEQAVVRLVQGEANRLHLDKKE